MPLGPQPWRQPWPASQHCMTYSSGREPLLAESRLTWHKMAFTLRVLLRQDRQLPFCDSMHTLVLNWWGKGIVFIHLQYFVSMRRMTTSGHNCNLATNAAACTSNSLPTRLCHPCDDMHLHLTQGHNCTISFGGHSGNSIGPEGADILAPILATLTALKILDLGWVDSSQWDYRMRTFQ